MKVHRRYISVLASLLFATVSFVPLFASPLEVTQPPGNNQLEVGGPLVGLEFHKGRALPSRISWYTPVANSIDLSNDYWTRYNSRPFVLLLHHEADTDTVGIEPCEVRWTPFSAKFVAETKFGPAEVVYRFGENLPQLRLEIKLHADGRKNRKVKLAAELRVAASLRTCHTYDWVEPDVTGTDSERLVAWASFSTISTDSAVLALAPLDESGAVSVEKDGNDRTWLAARVTLPKGTERVARFTLVSSRIDRWREEVDQVIDTGSADLDALEARLGEEEAAPSFSAYSSEAMEHTEAWSKVMVQSLRHELDGMRLPMPCPAQYNFFFTHDMLVTHLGSVKYDPDTVREDLLSLHRLAQGGVVLPHAYYWKDDQYVTEFCGTDNWNHLWFLLLSGSYMRHTGDVETIHLLAPMLQASLDALLENMGDDTLMCATHPDWWDIGKAYGPRTYLTAMTARAAEELVTTFQRAALPCEDAPRYLSIATSLRNNLPRLWDDEKGWLFDVIPQGVDPHYYAGVLVAVWGGGFEKEKSIRLVETAKRELLDVNLGVRNVMPPDFEELTDVYQFLPGEVGAPFIYANGAVWPQHNAWMALAQAHLGMMEDALHTVESYMTLEGIANSPGGQTSFFEYRNSNPDSPDYGRVDKPTFLWAGGWMLNATFRLAGLIDEPWGLRIDSHAPEAMANLSFNLPVPWGTVEIVRNGQGETFSSILADGEPVATTLLMGTPAKLEFQAGPPTRPYVESASALIEGIGESDGELWVDLTGNEGQSVEIVLISPSKPILTVSGDAAVETTTIPLEGGVRSTVRWVLTGTRARLELSL